MPDQRRPLLRLGVALLLVSAVLGLAAAIPLPHPSRWMVAHVTALMMGTLSMVEGLVWHDLRLSDGQRGWLVRFIYSSVVAGVIFGVLAAVMDLPGPASSPGVQATAAQGLVIGSLLTIIIPTTVGSWVLLWLGLRGDK